MSVAEKWPSLYSWGLEVYPIEGKAPVQAGGYYLYDPNQIFRFTLYWTLVFYTPAYALCALYAFINITFAPSRASEQRSRMRPSFSIPFASSYFGALSMGTVDHIQMTPRSAMSPGHHPLSSAQAKETLMHRYRARLKPNEMRSRLMLTLLVFLVFSVFSVAGAVIGAAIIGYVLAGLFKAGHFNMSTWIPFLAGLLQTLICFLGVWPSVVDII